MWNKRREEEPPRPFNPPSPAPVAPKPIEAKKEVTPVSSTPIGRFEPENRVSAATIGKAVKIVGQIYSKETCTSMVNRRHGGSAGAQAYHRAPRHRARRHQGARVVALGNITGNVEASEKIEIHKEAKLSAISAPPASSSRTGPISRAASIS